MPRDIAVLIPTFERPHNLERCLEFISVPRDVAGLFEVMVVDDGSRDESLELVRNTARPVSFPLGYTTHKQ